jgi:vacuole morphology and inheritance protein 14
MLTLKQLAADSELSVKNGAELLDRLIKDIVSESAASYVSVWQISEKQPDANVANDETIPTEQHTAFSLSRFIPLLSERITVLNPFTRMFLVSWITLLDSIPDLELVTYLPDFLGGLFNFLSDSNQDVHTATQVALDKFLAEIKKIARLKRGLALSKRSQAEEATKQSDSSPTRSDRSAGSGMDLASDDASVSKERAEGEGQSGSTNDDEHSDTVNDDIEDDGEEDWIPGQDVQVDHVKILDILVKFLGGSSGMSPARAVQLELTETEEEIQLTALRWIDSFFEICPEDILAFVPRLLSDVLPALSNDIEQVRQAADRVNTSLMDYILSLPEEESPGREDLMASQIAAQSAPILPSTVAKEPMSMDRKESTFSARHSRPSGRATPDAKSLEPPAQMDDTRPSPSEEQPTSRHTWNLDYEATVNALTLQFLNEHQATRVAALNWLIMLHRKAPPGRKLEINDGTFPALLKTLSDMSDAVVTRDLVLLSQMFRNSDESKFTSFMVNLLKLFCTDRRLLETRGNLIIRQLCVSLSAERIYKTLADCLEKDEVGLPGQCLE